MRHLRLCLVLAAMLTSVASGDDDSLDEYAIRSAINHALPVLQRSAKSFRERSEGRCISCHHQGLILHVVALARKRGFAVDESLAREEVDRVHGFYARRIPRYRAALTDPAALPRVDPFGNFTVHAGYWLWGLAAEGVRPDEATVTAAALLAKKQLDDGRWSFTDVARAPMQGGDFTTTALGAFALQQFGDSNQQGHADQLAAALAWLLNTPPRTTDDKAFRLFGLHWLGSQADHRRHAVDQLLGEQRGDGGWSQQANMPTDPYATGLVLVALHRAGGLPTANPAYQRGIKFLRNAQQSDGTWFVKSRAIPNNPYFESGFPYGKSQFISYAGSSWATLALLSATTESSTGPERENLYRPVTPSP